MMQKIFSQKIRFKDGNGMDYPEWEKKNLKYVLSEISEKLKKIINMKYYLLRQMEFLNSQNILIEKLQVQIIQGIRF